MDTRDTAVILLEAGERILASFPAALAAHSDRDCRGMDNAPHPLSSGGYKAFSTHSFCRW